MTVDTKIQTVESFKFDELLSNTGYTNEWILNMLKENNPEFLQKLGNDRVKNVTAKDISEAKGFLSHVFRVVVEFDNEKEYSFIMKIPTMECLDEIFKTMDMTEDAKTKMIDELKDTHNKECEAYQLIENVKDFPKVKTFYLEKSGEKKPGVIVMEDLSKKATTIGLFRSVTQQHCLNVARHFGNFQAQMNKNAETWNGKYMESFHTSDANMDDLPKYLTKAVDMKPELKEPIDRLLGVDVVKFNRYALNKLPEKFNATTLCQGDSWTNNFLIEVGDDGSLNDSISAVIDWQIIFQGNPYHDLSRFITLCADGEIRRDVEKKAVDLHYDTFCEKSKELGLQVGFTREQAHILYDHAAAQQVYELMGMVNFLKMTNMENTPEDVFEAQAEKIILRAKFALDDSIKRMDKHKIFEEFKK